VPDPVLFKPLIGMDATSSSPPNTVGERWPEDLSMGSSPEQHPMAWATRSDCYRGVYSAMGHGFESYQDPNYRAFLSFAFDWVSEARDVQTGCAP
ncbi:MAG: hypothetical protein HRT81_17425, partial [Henriciella sp.]|nr:hypothetical protein [Henriciella sp.]